MGINDTDLIDAIGTIYEAALDPECWERALERVASFTRAEGGILGLSDARAETAQLFVSYNVDPEITLRWATEFACEDPWASATTTLVEGDVVTGAELVPLEELRQKAVYREIHEKSGGQDVLAAIVAKSELRTGWVNVYPGPGRGLFKKAAVERMVPLVPHLQRSARIHTRFAELEQRANATTAALDALSFGVIACDERGRVLHANHRAEILLSEGEALTVHHGRLRAPRPTEEKRLEEVLSTTAETAARRSASGGGAVALPRRGQKPLTAVIAPVSPDLSAMRLTEAQVPASVVVVTDPDRPIDAPEGLLTELFGLTTTEARVAQSVARGERLESYAARAGVEVSTARWHLKRIFSKTCTARQAELVSLLLRSLGALF